MRFGYFEGSHPPDLSLRGVLKRKKQIASVCRKTSVELLFLHGSLARSRLKPLSDIDVAVLFEGEGPTFDQLCELREALVEIFGRDDVDLAVLNRASPLLWMQVLHHGVPLYVQKEAALKAFRLRAMQRYLRTGHLRRQFHRYMHAAILRRAS